MMLVTIRTITNVTLEGVYLLGTLSRVITIVTDKGLSRMFLTEVAEIITETGVVIWKKPPFSQIVVGDYVKIFSCGMPVRGLVLEVLNPLGFKVRTKEGELSINAASIFEVENKF